MTENRCDVAIIGGGPVGAALALALQGNDLNVVLLEARDTPINTTDPRSLALAYGTRLLLQRLGAWDTMQNVSGIKTIEVTQKNTSGHTTLHADELKVSGNGLCAALHHAACRFAATPAAIGCHLPVRRDSQRSAQFERRHTPSLTSIREKNTRSPRASRSSPKAASCSKPRIRRRSATTARAASSPTSPVRSRGRGWRSSTSRRRDRWRCCPIWTVTNWC